MTINNGSVANADEVNNVFLTASLLARARAIVLDKSEASGFSNLDETGNYVLSPFANTSDSDSAITDMFVDDSDYVTATSGNRSGYSSNSTWVSETFGLAETTNWTTSFTNEGTATFSTNYISANNPTSSDSAALLSNGTTPLDFKAFSGNSEFIVAFKSSQNSISHTCELQISNGTTHIPIWSRNVGGSGSPPYTRNDLVRVAVDKVGQQVYVWSNGTWTGTPTAIDISSVTTNWYLRVYVGGGASVGWTRLYRVGVLDGTSGTLTVSSEDTTMTSTKSAGITVFSGDAAVTPYLSADGGANYNAATLNTWTTITNTGTECRVKVEADKETATTGNSLIMKRIGMIGGYFNG